MMAFLVRIFGGAGTLLVGVGIFKFNLVADDWSLNFFLLLLVVSSRVLR